MRQPVPVEEPKVPVLRPHDIAEIQRAGRDDDADDNGGIVDYFEAEKFMVAINRQIESASLWLPAWRCKKSL